MDTREEKLLVMDTLLEFLDQPEKCDVKFNVHLGGDAWMPFWGHRLILKIWSPVFEAHFFEKENDESYFEIDIKGYPPTVFKHFLRFMYGCLDGIEENKSNGKCLLDLYKLAEIYQIEQLKKECRKTLITSTVEIDNVFQFLNAANYINLEIVQLRCFKLLREKTAEVIAEQDLKKITSSMVFTILTLDKLSLSSEYDLLTWVFEWAESECNKLPQTKPQNIIEPFLPYLNFASLKAEQFGALVNRHQEFFHANDGFRIFLNICAPGPDCMPLPSWHSESKNFRSYKVLNCEDLTTISSGGQSNDTQKNTTPVELSSNVETAVGEPNEDLRNVKDNTSEKLENPVIESTSKSDTLANNIDCTDDKSSFKNIKPQEYFTNDVTDSLNNQVSPDQLVNQCHSLHDSSSDDLQVAALDCSISRRKIKKKKKKVKKLYLLPGGKSDIQAKSMDLLDETYSSGDFQSLIGMVWMQNRSTAKGVVGKENTQKSGRSRTNSENSFVFPDGRAPVIFEI